MKAAWPAIVTLLAVTSSGCIGIPTLFQQRVAVALAAVPAAPLPARPSSNPTQRLLNLDQCIEVARRNNPNLSAGSLDIQTAFAQQSNAVSERWPNLRLAGSFVEYRNDLRLLAARLNQEPGLFSSGIAGANIVLKMPLFTGGRITSEITAADFQIQVAQNRLARSWEELIFNISSTYYTILAQRRLIDSLEFSRKALGQQRKRVINMMAADKAAKVDVLRTEVRLADVEQRLVREKTTLEIQRHVLALLMGIGYGNSPPDVTGSLANRHTVPALNTALAMAYGERGDLRAARSTVEAQEMKLRSARSAVWPQVSLEGTYGVAVASGISDDGKAYTNQVNSKSQPLRGPWSYPDSSVDVGTLGVVLNYPIFDGGRISSQIREQEAKLGLAIQAQRKIELQIRLDVETAMLNVNSASQRGEFARKAIEQAEESFRIEQQKYDLGKGTITDVLDAQSAMLDAETNYYRALADLNIAIAQLGMATGEKR